MRHMRPILTHKQTPTHVKDRDAQTGAIDASRHSGGCQNGGRQFKSRAGLCSTLEIRYSRKGGRSNREAADGMIRQKASMFGATAERLGNETVQTKSEFPLRPRGVLVFAVSHASLPPTHPPSSPSEQHRTCP
ncbi:unnamed protein product [Protopolystoma xenopodis]|uniref:Uncharacterized protein n=1 Tax=Protopolystoma xenopodis TaxID=117903 RepID=A0A3S5FDK4_9PLAT|nr:unnamed protein product [Protopolystoma xenopodis]